MFYNNKGLLTIAEDLLSLKASTYRLKALDFLRIDEDAQEIIKKALPNIWKPTAPARFHRVAFKTPTSAAPTSGGFFLRCQIFQQASEILPQPQEIPPQAQEIVPQVQEIIPQVQEMVPQVQEMIKQHCGMISVIDNLFILLFICYIYN